VTRTWWTDRRPGSLVLVSVRKGLQHLRADTSIAQATDRNTEILGISGGGAVGFTPLCAEWSYDHTEIFERCLPGDMELIIYRETQTVLLWLVCLTSVGCL